MTRPSRIITSTTAVLTALALASCSMKGTGMGPSDAPRTRNVVTVQTTLDTAFEEVRDRITELHPGMPWRETSERATAPCNTEDGPGGTWHKTGQIIATGVNASVDEWPAWKAAVDQILAGHGFAPPHDIASEGPARMLKYTNAEGDVFTFSANPQGTGISASSSCFIAETSRPGSSGT